MLKRVGFPAGFLALHNRQVITMRNDYYTYAYMRKDGTPYYIGKGRGNRAFQKGGRCCQTPPKDRVLFLKTGLTEEEAFRHEVYMISVFGRKDLGTGILRNLTNGGEGTSGWKAPQEYREKARQRRLGWKWGEETRRKIGEKHKGKIISEETRQKCKENAHVQVGWFWVTNGEEETMIPPDASLPSGWTVGRKPTSDYTRKLRSIATSGENNPMYGVEPKTKGMRWYKHLGEKKEKMYVPGEQPRGWETGRLTAQDRR